MDHKRVERTLLHKKIGLFGYSREFNKYGIVSPYMQVVFIGRIIEEQMKRAERLPSLSDNTEVNRWLQKAVEKQVNREKDEPAKLEPLPHLALSTARAVAWDPYRDFAELLNAYCGPRAYQNAANKLGRLGYGVSVENLSDLTQPFVTLRLGRAVKSFDPKIGVGREAEWLTTVFYRFALKHVISDRQNKLSLDELRSAEAQSPSPLEELESKSKEAVLSALPEAMDQLPEEDRRALELYFGFHGRERTLAEVARELGTSQYLVRAQIVRSIGTLASKLGIHGELRGQEYSLVQMLFGEGMDVKTAARRLDINQREVRDLLERVNEKLNEGLRRRTKKSHRYDLLPEPKEETIMSNNALMSDEQIVIGLKELVQVPELRPRETGLEAKLRGNWVRVDRVRELVLRKNVGEELISSLEEQGVELGWLITPDPAIERADLPVDYYEWAEELERLADRSWIAAETLYIRILNEAAQHHIFLPEEAKQETIERIFRTLGGISQAIEAEVPRRFRRKGKCYFRIEMTGSGEAFGRWENDSENQDFDMKNEIQYRAGLLGELPDEFASLFADVLIQEIFEGEMTLPAFRRLDQSTRTTVWLELLPRSSELSLEARESSNKNSLNSDYSERGATTV